MPGPTDADISRAEGSWFSLVLWRLAAGTAFALSLLSIKFGLLGAVFLLLTSIVCLPGARAALRQKTGLRIPGAANAAAATLLALFGIASAGTGSQTEPRSAAVVAEAGERPALSIRAP